MPRILLTSGPTRQYLDPVRFLTNASSGRMGAALAQALLDRGQEVVIVSGPVEVEYPAAARVVKVLTTEEMLAACQREFPTCAGLIGAAAPCDYRPHRVAEQKLHKTGQPLVLQLEETPDIVAALAAQRKPGQWTVGFALETEDQHFRAVTKLQRKSCDLIILNGPAAISAEENSVEVFDPGGQVVLQASGPKPQVARKLVDLILSRLVMV